MQVHYVCEDLGASGTRYVSNNGYLNMMANNMVFMGLDEHSDLEPNSEAIEEALDVTIESNSACTVFPCHVLIGKMAERYSPTNERPSVLQNKHLQRVNYVSAIVAVALSKLKNQNMGENIQLYIALPPGEVRVAKDIVRNNLLGQYKVTFNKFGGAQVVFNITDVSVYEESFMAMLSYFFEKDGTLSEKAKKYARGITLSMDIGASTTDLAVIKDMKYIEHSGQTYRTGGNVARDILGDYIRETYGYDAPVESLELAMAEGRIQFGATYKDCSKAVDNAKKVLASQIVEMIQGYFRKINIPLNLIMGIIVSGGGSMQSQYIDEDGNEVVTSQPISTFITEELNKICSGVAVEHISNQPRLANIYGLFIRANVDIRKKERQAALAAQQAQQAQPVQQAQPAQPVQQAGGIGAGQVAGTPVNNAPEFQVQQPIMQAQPVSGVAGQVQGAGASVQQSSGLEI